MTYYMTYYKCNLKKSDLDIFNVYNLYILLYSYT